MHTHARTCTHTHTYTPWYLTSESVNGYAVLQLYLQLHLFFNNVGAVGILLVQQYPISFLQLFGSCISDIFALRWGQLTDGNLFYTEHSCAVYPVAFSVWFFVLYSSNQLSAALRCLIITMHSDLLSECVKCINAALTAVVDPTFSIVIIIIHAQGQSMTLQWCLKVCELRMFYISA